VQISQTEMRGLRDPIAYVKLGHHSFSMEPASSQRFLIMGKWNSDFDYGAFAGLDWAPQ
jgi:hypothetical protein